MLNRLLDSDQMDELMHAFVDVDLDDPSEDEAFTRMATLFNRIYGMGQEHERQRWVMLSSEPPHLERT